MTARRALTETLSNDPVGGVRPPKWKPIVSQGLLTVVLAVILFPFVWMLLTALKPADQALAVPPTAIGREIRWSNFAEAWSYVDLGQYTVNSLVVAVGGTLIVLVVSSLSGYAFSRLNFRGRAGLFVLFMATLMVPQEVLVVPMFVLMQQLGWLNSYQGLILPWAFTAFGTFLLRQVFLTIPMELEEAAELDGASRLRFLAQILVPISRPSLAVLAIFTFVAYWNSLLWPLIVVNSTSLATLPLGLQMFKSINGNQWHLLMAASAITMIPTVLLVVLLQRYLVRGLALAGLGGR